MATVNGKMDHIKKLDNLQRSQPKEELNISRPYGSSQFLMFNTPLKQPRAKSFDPSNVKRKISENVEICELGSREVESCPKSLDS